MIHNRGIRVLVVASNNKGYYAPFIPEQCEALRRFGIEYEMFGVVGNGIHGYLRNLKSLRKAIDRFHPDIIHAHYGLCGLLANLQRQVPVITTYHGSDINEPLILPFSRIAMRLSAHNIFVSDKTMAIALSSPHKHCGVPELSGAHKRSWKQRCSLIPCGVNLEDLPIIDRLEARKKLGLKEDGLYVLFAGAFANPVKNSKLAKEAIEYLNASLHGIIPTSGTGSNGKAGSAANASGTGSNGDTEETAKSSVSGSNGNTGKTTELLELKGYSREQVTLLMNAADALIMTSLTEGSPQVVKEAMAVGCPVVSVDVGDVSNLICGLENCHIADRTPEALASALKLIIESGTDTRGSDARGTDTRGSDTRGTDTEGTDTAQQSRKRLIALGLTNDIIAQKLVDIFSKWISL